MIALATGNREVGCLGILFILLGNLGKISSDYTYTLPTLTDGLTLRLEQVPYQTLLSYCVLRHWHWRDFVWNKILS